MRNTSHGATGHDAPESSVTFAGIRTLSTRAVNTLDALPRSLEGLVFPISQNALQLSWERLCKSARKKHLMDRLRRLLAQAALSPLEIESEIRALVFKKRSPSRMAVSKWTHLEEEDQTLLDLHFHDLRHEATSRLADLLQMHELMKVTGHKTSAMLSRYYHPRAEDLASKLP